MTEWYDEIVRGTPRQPALEPLWTLRRNDRTAQCTLRYHGEFGFEAALEMNGEFLASQRFPSRTDAIAWADNERTELEARGWRLAPPRP